VRHYPSQHTHTGWKLLIKPAKRSVADFREKLRATFRVYRLNYARVS
jgi:hypothetical protein